jgi:hypothetical protein
MGQTYVYNAGKAEVPDKIEINFCCVYKWQSQQ